MKRFILPGCMFCLILAMMLLHVRVSFAAETATVGRIVDEGAAIRSVPSEEGRIIARLPREKLIDILKANQGDGSWVYVSADGVRGYVRNRYVDTELSVFDFTYPRTVRAAVEGTVTVYRNANGTGSLGALEPGQSYDVLKMYASARFHRIRFGKNTGYVEIALVEEELRLPAKALASLSVEGAELIRPFFPERKGYVAKVTDANGQVTMHVSGAGDVSAEIRVGDDSYYGAYSFTLSSGSAKRVPVFLDGVQAYEVVFCRDVLTVANWNIKRGNNRLVSQAALIAAHDLDILSLQEVYVNEGTSSRTNNLMALRTGRLTESLFTRTKTFEENIGQYGIGILSAWQILESESYVLPSSELGLEQRALQKIVFSWHGCRISLYNCHLSYERTSARRRQYTRVMEIISADTSAYKILTGDFNEQWPLFNELRGWIVTNGRGLQFYGYDGLPFKRTTVDNILVTDNFTVLDVAMEDVLLSDHKPLFVMLSIEQ